MFVCFTHSLISVDEFTPEDFDIQRDLEGLDVMHNEFKATWIAPETPPLGYVLMYRPLGSQETTTISYPGATIPNAVIGNLLPTTTYSVQVRAEFREGQSGTTGEFIVTTEAGMPLSCAHFNKQHDCISILLQYICIYKSLSIYYCYSMCISTHVIVCTCQSYFEV